MSFQTTFWTNQARAARAEVATAVAGAEAEASGLRQQAGAETAATTAGAKPLTQIPCIGPLV